MHTTDNVKLRWGPMQRDHDGFQLWSSLEDHPKDERVIKRRFSAFIQGSSNIENILHDYGIDTLIITGVATNVCCESIARGAMMLNYGVAMVSDGCVTASDVEPAATIGHFYLYFGDVQTTSELIERLKI